jgi:5'-methylthioinosine phosphorylase
MTELAVIGGSGFDRMQGLEIVRKEQVDTPFGRPSAPLIHGTFQARRILFLPRHGEAHTIPPHQVNYRANLWALKQAGATRVVGVAAVGGIHGEMGPGTIVIPDQIIDYTYGREHTLFEGDLSEITHIDFTLPYCESLRRTLIVAAERAAVEVINAGTYGATQGPRLESAMEINRLERDGCDLVGMTGMPEAALARELELCYAGCAVVANRAAGRGEGEITMAEIERNLVGGMERVRLLLSAWIAAF